MSDSTIFVLGCLVSGIALASTLVSFLRPVERNEETVNSHRSAAASPVASASLQKQS